MIAKPVAKGYKIGLISLPEYFDTHTHTLRNTPKGDDEVR